MLKSTRSLIQNLWHGTSIWAKLFGLLVTLIIVLLVNHVWLNKDIEGFSLNNQNQQKLKKFRTKHRDQIYDDFYAQVYDELLFSKVKNDFEVGEIINQTAPSEKSRILDIGSGNGHHVSSFVAHGFDNTIGLDVSPSMVKHARELYPGLQFKVGDALDTMQFQSNAFTLITCLYFTLYYIDNKPLFFKNCYKWLMPGGFLAVHIVDPKNFDPIMPAGDPFLYVSPQNYAKERITTSVVKFNNFDYKSKFDLKSASDEDGPNAVLTETFKDHGSGNVRVNEHELYMPEPQEIIDMAKDAGFIVSAQIDMLKCQYAYQYIYIFQKPT